MTVSLLIVVFHKEEKLILSISRRSRSSHTLIFPPHESGRPARGRGKSALKQEEEQDHKSFITEWKTLSTSTETATRKEGGICSETGEGAESELFNERMENCITIDFPNLCSSKNRKKEEEREEKSVLK